MRSRLPSPLPPSDIVLYPEILISALERLESTESVGLVGPSGYGKTALAQQIVRDAKAAELFGDSIYWVGIGRDLSGPDLAQRLNDITYIACGSRADLTDPMLAAQYLAGRLDFGTAMFVFDDVWQPEWPDIFKFITTRCPVLVTTRDASLLTDNIGSYSVTRPSVELGANVLEKTAPKLDSFDCKRISAVTKARPFLLRLVSAQLEQEISAGRPSQDAVNALLSRVAQDPHIDRVVVSLAGEGAGLTAESLVSWSLQRLSAARLDQLSQLALFQSDSDIPLRLLATCWDVDEHEAFAIAIEYRNQSLISRVTYYESGYTLSIHDILLDYLRARLSIAGQAELHRKFIAKTVGVDLEAGVDFRDSVALGDAIARDKYLSENIIWHLRMYLSQSHLESVVTDPEYLGARVARSGVGAVLSDLALVDKNRSVRIARLTQFIGSTQHVKERDHIAASVRSFLDDERPPDEIAPGYVQVFSLSSLDEPLVLRGSILSCSLSGMDTEVLLTTSEGIVAVLRAADLEPVIVRRMRGGWTRACAFLPDGVAVGSDDGLIRIFKGSDELASAVLAGHRAEIRSLAVSPDGRWIVSGSDDATIRLWDLTTGLLLMTFAGHTDRVRCVAVSPDSTWIASTSDDGTVRLWDVATGNLIRSLLGHSNRVRAVAISPSGEWVVSVSDDGTVRRWATARSDTESVVLGDHGCVVRDVAFTWDGESVVTAGAHDNLVSVWSVKAEDERRANLVGHHSWVMCCAASRLGQWCVSGSDDGTVRRWDLVSGSQEACREGRNEWAYGVAQTRDGSRLFACTTAGRVLEVGDSRPEVGMRQIQLADGCRGLALRGSEGLLVSGDGGEITSVTLGSGEWSWSNTRLSARSVRRIHYENHLNTAITCCHEGAIYLIACSSDGAPMVLKSFRTNMGSVYEAQLLPSSGLIVSAHESGDVCIHTSDGQLISALSMHRGPALSIDVSRQGTLCASGGDDGRVRQLAIDANGVLTDAGTLVKHDDWVSQVVFCPDSSRVASVSDDHTLRITDVRSQLTTMVLAFEQPLYCASWGDQADGLIVGGGSGVYRIFGI